MTESPEPRSPAGAAPHARPPTGPMTDGRLIRSSLAARPVSTVATVLLVGIAAALLIVLLTVREQSEQWFRRGSGNTHLLVSADSSPLESVLNNIFYANAPRRALAWSRYQQLAGARPYRFAIPTQQGDSYLGRPVVATTPAYLAAFEPNPGEPWAFAAGRAFEAVYDDTAAPAQRRASLELVAGAEAARTAFLAVGDRLTLSHGTPRNPAAHVHREYTFEVVGILEPTGTPHDRALFVPLEASWLLHAHDRRKADIGWDGSLTTAADIAPADRLITAILLALPSRGTGPPAALQQVFDELRRDPTITVASPARQIDRLFEIVGGVDDLILVVAWAVLVAGAASVGIALASAMGQRRRQIAGSSVLGASRAREFSLVLTESAVIGAAGAAVGVLIALAGLRAAQSIAYARLGLAFDGAVSPTWAVVVAAGAVMLAAAAGGAPAWVAYRTPVVRHLRPIA